MLSSTQQLHKIADIVKCYNMKNSILAFILFSVFGLTRAPSHNPARVYLSPLHLLGRHDNDPRVLLEHHPPEVTDGVLQAALRGDVALL